MSNLGSFMQLAVPILALVVLVGIVALGVFAVASSLGKRHGKKHGKGGGRSTRH